MHWIKSRLALLLGILVLPPVGLILLWIRPLGIWKKLGGSVLVLMVGVMHLVFLYGMRFEAKGDGITPMFSFRKPEAHIAQLEKSREEQKRAAAAPVEAPVAVVAASTQMPTVAAETGYWTDFRGPQRDGVYRQGPVMTEWPASGLKPLWKQPIGAGYASFVMAGKRAYTIEQRRDKEYVAAYDLETGKEVWTHSYAAHFEESMGGDGPRATPTYHDGLVYSMGATGELRVLDAKTGALRWGKNILSDAGASNIMWGMSASPLIVDEKVVVQPGGAGNSIVAYDKKTGKKVWGSLDDAQAYTSPMLVTMAGKRQILTVTANRVVGLAPESGKLLWEYPWKTQYDVNSAQPILIGENQFFISAGYGHGAALVEVSGTGTAKTVWENNRMKNRFNTSVVYEGYAYGLDEGIFSCMRLSDGQQMWKAGRYGYGQLLLAGNRIVLITETGELVLIQPAAEKLVELAKFAAIEGKTWNVPAIENGILLVRNGNEMAAFSLLK